MLMLVPPPPSVRIVERRVCAELTGTLHGVASSVSPGKLSTNSGLIPVCGDGSRGLEGQRWSRHRMSLNNSTSAGT
ncbi:hypothetical protein GN956_G10132 [Arapaima gigas]